MAGVFEALHDGFATFREAPESGPQPPRVRPVRASELKSRRHDDRASRVAAAKLRNHPGFLEERQ